jgi:Flp pilus assembly protein TadD
VTGVRKLFVKPATASAKYTVAGVRKLFNRSDSNSTEIAQEAEVKPVVSIEDGAGQPEKKAESAIKASDEAMNSSPHEPMDPESGPDDVITPAMAASYRELAVTKPYDATVRYNLGRLYLQQGLLEEATYEFDMATSLDPKMAYAFILLGRTLRLRGMHDLALAKFTAATKLQADLPLVYVDTGVCWDERGHHGKARDAYFKALALAPNDSSIYNNIGYSYFLDGEYGDAIEYYRRALRLDPDNRQINNNVALAYATQQKWDKVLYHFTQALGEAGAQNNVGHLLLRAGRVDEALAHLEIAVRLNPDSARALGNLESALRLKGRIDDAEKLHARLVEVEKTRVAPARTVTTAAHEQPQ